MNYIKLLRSVLNNNFLTESESSVICFLIGTRNKKVDKLKISSTFRRVNSLADSCDISRNTCYRALEFLKHLGLLEFDIVDDKIEKVIIGKQDEIFVNKYLNVESNFKRNTLQDIFDFNLQVLLDSSKKYCFTTKSILILEYIYEICYKKKREDDVEFLLEILKNVYNNIILNKKCKINLEISVDKVVLNGNIVEHENKYKYSDIPVVFRRLLIHVKRKNGEVFEKAKKYFKNNKKITKHIFKIKTKMPEEFESLPTDNAEERKRHYSKNFAKSYIENINWEEWKHTYNWNAREMLGYFNHKYFEKFGVSHEAFVEKFDASKNNENKARLIGICKKFIKDNFKDRAHLCTYVDYVVKNIADKNYSIDWLFSCKNVKEYYNNFCVKNEEKKSIEEQEQEYLKKIGLN